MLPVHRFGCLTQPVLILDEREREVRLDVRSATGLVQRRVVRLLPDFGSRPVDIGEFVSKQFKRVIGDRDQLDPVVDIYDVVAVSVAFPNLFWERETPSVVERCIGHTSHYDGKKAKDFPRNSSTLISDVLPSSRVR